MLLSRQDRHSDKGTKTDSTAHLECGPESACNSGRANRTMNSTQVPNLRAVCSELNKKKLCPSTGNREPHPPIC